jgi:hypothetical protein
MQNVVDGHDTELKLELGGPMVVGSDQVDPLKTRARPGRETATQNCSVAHETEVR